MTPADVDRAIAWSQARGLRLDFAFNGGGSALYGPAPRRPAGGQVRRPGRERRFGFINHTLRAPEPGLLDVARSSPARSRPTWPGRAPTGSPSPAPAELVTGEHSGLANARPGNPGTIDPPAFDDVEPLAGGGACPPAPTTTR